MTRCFFSAILTTIISVSVQGQANNEPWKNNQLMSPAKLAEIIHKPGSSKPVIISIGPGAPIKGSVDIGPPKDNFDKLKKELGKYQRDREIVIYCGCCPFQHCPNIRPAFKLLNDMKFTSHKLLNIEKNLKTDWIGKGYPVRE